MGLILSQVKRENRFNIRFLFQTHKTNEQLNSFYKVLSTNTDGTTEFVSTVEGRLYRHQQSNTGDKGSFIYRRLPLGSVRLPDLRDSVAPGEERVRVEAAVRSSLSLGGQDLLLRGSVLRQRRYERGR